MDATPEIKAYDQDEVEYAVVAALRNLLDIKSGNYLVKRERYLQKK